MKNQITVVLLSILALVCACSSEDAPPATDIVAVPTLLRQPAVQQDLELLGPQIEQIAVELAKCHESADEQSSDYQCLGVDEPQQESIWMAVLATLSDEQKARLTELTYQKALGRVLLYPSTWEMLGLSPDQVTQIEAVGKENELAYEQLLVDMSRIRFPSEEAMFAYVDEARQEADGRLLAVLSAEQQQLLNTAMGSPLREQD